MAATEDSWEYTLVPRLKAHRANMSKIFRIDVVEFDDEDGVGMGLVLPQDNRGA